MSRNRLQKQPKVCLSMQNLAAVKSFQIQQNYRSRNRISKQKLADFLSQARTCGPFSLLLRWPAATSCIRESCIDQLAITAWPVAGATLARKFRRIVAGRSILGRRNFKGESSR
jgi:hypothetical protein